jgi:hypothetical protein
VTRPLISPENCPEPFNHEVFRYCPICTWTEPHRMTELEALKIVEVKARTVLGPNAFSLDEQATQVQDLFEALEQLDKVRAGG